MDDGGGSEVELEPVVEPTGHVEGVHILVQNLGGSVRRGVAVGSGGGGHHLSSERDCREENEGVR